MSGLPSVPPILHSEPLPLDLLNTNLYLDGAWIDLLDDKTNRVDWLTAELARVGTSASTATMGSAAVTAALKDVRTDARRAIESARLGDRPTTRALAGLNAATKAAPAVPRADWSDGAVVMTAHRHGPSAVRIAACFAEATMELLAGPAIHKVRRCEAPACAILFLAENPRRRWCTPDVCGNRARVARYYLRHKTDTPTPDQL